MLVCFCCLCPGGRFSVSVFLLYVGCFCHDKVLVTDQFSLSVRLSCFQALKFIIVLDTVGLLCGWKLFDHAAHLAGVLFGM